MNFGLVQENNGSFSPLGFIEAQVSGNPIYVHALSVEDLKNQPPQNILQELVDFDGNHLGGSDSWVIKTEADVQGDGDKEFILFNQEIGRWATVGPDTNDTIDLVPSI